MAEFLEAERREAKGDLLPSASEAKSGLTERGGAAGGAAVCWGACISWGAESF